MSLEFYQVEHTFTGTQTIQLMTKKDSLPLKTDYLESYFSFVPLLGKEGFKRDF